MTSKSPDRGEIWLVRFDPSIGDEIKKSRTAVVISSVGTYKVTVTAVADMLKKAEATITVAENPLFANKCKVISAGRNQETRAISTDGNLWDWGGNINGQLGDGTTINRNTPVKIMDSVASVSVGFDHTLAIKTDGSLWGWGGNS